MDLPAIGTRISLSSSLGTIKFVGHVENTTGIWLGVEWDEPTRGKHSGSKNGKQYFECRYVIYPRTRKESQVLHYEQST